MNTFTALSGTMAKSFRVSRDGPTLSAGSTDPNSPVNPVPGRPGDLYFLLGATPRAFLLGGDNLWRALSTEQPFVRRKVVSATDSPSNDDYYLGVGGTGTVTITLPPGETDKRFVIKDELGDPNREIVVVAAPGQTIDRQTSFRIVQPHASIHLVFGDEWHVF